jgi:hypothetical protein
MEEQENNIYVLIKHVSKSEEQEIVKRGYVLHLPYKRKRDEVRKETEMIKSQKTFCKEMGCRKNQLCIIDSGNCLLDMKRR